MTMGYVYTLIFKRTHKGDPDESGIFGCHNCMGKIRGWKFDSVIGIGGKKPWTGHKDIALKINWIGLEPEEVGYYKSGPLVAFKHFCLFEEKGRDLKTVAPQIFKYMFQDKNRRFIKSPGRPDNMQKEITKILKLAEKCPKSPKTKWPKLKKSKWFSSRKESRGKCK